MKLFDFVFNLRKTGKKRNTIIVAKYYNDLIYILNGELYCNNTIITIEEARKRESDYIGYQAYMDYAKGSATPEEAYFLRGYVKQDNMWVKKHEIDKIFI